MFGNFSIGPIVPQRIDPKDIPEPTPINLPRYQPFAQEDASLDLSEALPTLLQHTGRSTTSLLGPKGLSAIGLNLHLDASPEQLVPDPSYIPDFQRWEQLSADQAREENQLTRNPLRNGNFSPGCQTFLERKKELSNTNQDGFRTVRRIPPPKGKQHARLGNAYEFFRCLEMFTTFWDDPTQPPELPPSPEMGPSEASNAADGVSSEQPKEEEEFRFQRTAVGHSMPADYRQNLLSAFIKLVAYDFGCNVSMARVEPRLHISSPEGAASPRKSYFPSNTSFIFQTPTTREAARAGNVYGPAGAVSARPTTEFTTPDMETAQSLDLAREIVAALITAQHRAREGKTETRFGEGQWWTQNPRWGGGSGGPIGREIEKDTVQGDKDSRPSDSDGRPMAKKPRKNMSIYDNYRMVRPPSTTWDKKARYEAIGKQSGADYDDVFVVSSLFHHISILRVRVPARLLEVLDGSPEPDLTKRSWGGVQAWRSPWFDMFRTDERIEAMKTLWPVMAYQMRKDTPEGDVAMTDA
ncbi:hypothetical protein ACO1O0_007351 [Amphichorda felina]